MSRLGKDSSAGSPSKELRSVFMVSSLGQDGDSLSACSPDPLINLRERGGMAGVGLPL